MSKKKVKIPDVIRMFYIDETGNNYIRFKSNDKRIEIKLKVAGDNKMRLIGHVTKSTKTLHVKRSYSKHLFRNGNAYGFNDYVMRETKEFDKIILSDEYNNWKFPLEFLMSNGRYLNFKQQGFELQRFLSMEQLEPYRVKKEENRRI